MRQRDHLHAKAKPGYVFVALFVYSHQQRSNATRTSNLQPSVRLMIELCSLVQFIWLQAREDNLYLYAKGVQLGNNLESGLTPLIPWWCQEIN
jgi:hypothetical protein